MSPMYRYGCLNESCNHEMDCFQQMSDPPHKACPKCGKRTLERQIGPTKFKFKGTGWECKDTMLSDPKKICLDPRDKQDDRLY